MGFEKFVEATIQDVDENGVLFNVLKVLNGFFVVRCTHIWKDEYKEKIAKHLCGEMDMEIFLSLPLNIPYYLEDADYVLRNQRRYGLDMVMARDDD